jgi:uncharacterized protein YndB with AHSA1/START domain
MAPQSIPTVTADTTVNADPDTLYRLITDLPTLAALAEETTAMRWTKGDSVRPGAVFKGTNRNGSRSWTTTCTVTEAEPGRVFAWDVRSGFVPIAHWRYEITPGDNDCRVTESMWDHRPGWFRGIASRATGVYDRESANADHIRMTLQRLKARAEA